MKPNLLIALLLVTAVACTQTPRTPIDSVHVFNGTDFHGHTYPGATTPFGLVQLSPDTRTEGWDGCSGYHYSDDTILGFSHTHLSGTGCADLGDFLFTPGLGEVGPLPFSHSDESASPGYYKVKFPAGITAELTAAAHTGVHRYTFTGKGVPRILVDAVHCIGDGTTALESDVSALGPQQICGHRLVDGWSQGRDIFIDAFFSVPFEAEEAGSDQAHWLGITAPGARPNFDRPVPELTITPELRQQGYEEKSTTDDHGMHLYGIAKDQNGNKYYMVKNSWGETGKYKGVWYVSEAFVRYKTMDFMVHKDAIPKDIKKKLGIK